MESYHIRWLQYEIRIKSLEEAFHEQMAALQLAHDTARRAEETAFDRCKSSEHHVNTPEEPPREILSGAGLACVAWWRFARDEPALWRRINLTAAPPDEDDTKKPAKDDVMVEGDGEDLSDDDNDEENMPAMDVDTVEGDDGDLNDSDDESLLPVCQEKTPAKVRDDSSGWKAMALAAIHRSASQCEAFWGRADDEVLLYLADKSGLYPLLFDVYINVTASSMKSLRVTSHYDVSSEVFAEVIKKFPLLEELELVLKPDEACNYTTKSGQAPTDSWVELFQSACEACSHLHNFTVRRASKVTPSDSYYQSRERSSPTPFSIPVMHGLRSLELSGGSFTKDVVMQIVHKCPSLESLDISDAPIYSWDEELRNKCSRTIKVGPFTAGKLSIHPARRSLALSLRLFTRFPCITPPETDLRGLYKEKSPPFNTPQEKKKSSIPRRGDAREVLVETPAPVRQVRQQGRGQGEVVAKHGLPEQRDKGDAVKRWRWTKAGAWSPGSRGRGEVRWHGCGLRRSVSVESLQEMGKGVLGLTKGRLIGERRSTRG
ncbi:hypothetical protein C2845_PM05G18630 [Panicum miliaceum]|uniref:Uncharacterized protein n=1 Tax=Panicum miliaceum TaxID=4540 RepID=A0A3L6SY28_PANMI|nr:hypothetical protein C2845_PM05G18630 [Panicum miliaceum]